MNSDLMGSPPVRDDRPVGIPSSLRELWNSPAFWAGYTFAHADGPGADRLGDLKDQLDDLDDDDNNDEPDDEQDQNPDDTSAIDVEFDVGDGHRVLLTLDDEHDMYDLEIVTPGDAATAGLGWDDLAHWHPYGLRWSELDLICRAIAALDARLPHPGAPLALLCRFAAVFEDDDVDSAVAAVDAAYASLRPQQWDGYWPRAADWLDRADFRGQNVVWRRDPAGHLWASQDEEHEKDFYSTRGEPASGADFPYVQLEALLAAAATTVSNGGGGDAVRAE